MRRKPLGAALLTLLLAACAPLSPAHLVVAPLGTAAGARLTLHLQDLQDADRRILAILGQAAQWKISIDAPDLAAPFQKTVTTADGTLNVTLDQVPAGGRRVIALQGVDAEGAEIKNALFKVAANLKPGDNALTVSGGTTPAAEVLADVLAMDRSKKTQVALAIDADALNEAVTGYMRALHAPTPILLDHTAIATALYSANGTLPAVQPAFLLHPGRVVVRPLDLPDGAGFSAVVNDPSSALFATTEHAPVTLSNVLPGSWKLTVTPDVPGIPAQTLDVTVTAGGTTDVPLTFSASTAQPALPFPLCAGASGAVQVGGVDTLVALGGTSYDDVNALVDHTGVQLYTQAGGWKQGPTLNTPVIDAASAVASNKLYIFGGHDGNQLLGTASVFDPAGNNAPTPLPSLPAGLTLQGASAGLLGTTIFVAGGVVDGNATPNAKTLAFDTGGNTWLSAAQPALPTSRADMTSVVLNGKWYLFGGWILDNVISNGNTTPFPVPQPDVSILNGGSSPVWSSGKDMPTVRSGAGAVAVNGKIYVLGGVGELGVPSRAVEVYDPAADSWTVKPPLKVGRAFPTVGLVGGKIIVAGGLAGIDPLTALPVDQVEAVTP